MPNSNNPENPFHDAVNAIKISVFHDCLHYINEHEGMTNLLLMSHIKSPALHTVVDYIFYEQDCAAKSGLHFKNANDAFTWCSPSAASEMANEDDSTTQTAQKLTLNIDAPEAQTTGQSPAQEIQPGVGLVATDGL